MRKHEIKNILVQYFVDEEILNENALSLIVDVQSVSSSKKLELKFQIRQLEIQEREKEREREREREKREEREGKRKGKRKGEIRKGREREGKRKGKRKGERRKRRGKREREKRGEREKEREFQLRMGEIEMQERANQPKQKIEYNYDVTKHIRLVAPFQEKEVDKYFLHFEKVAENLNWPKEHWTLLLQSVLIGKAREIYTQLGVIIMRLLKNLFSKVMSWSQKHIDKKLEIVKRILTRLMLNLLETKNSYLIDGAVLRK